MVAKATVVHVTHEATQKIGGIGAVLAGLFTCDAYLKAVPRSIVIAPLFERDVPISKRLGPGGRVLHCSLDGLGNCEYSPSFGRIQDSLGVEIVYGTKTFTDPQTQVSSSPEIVLVDVRRMHTECVNELKKHLYENFGIESDQYEHIWEYEQYIRLAPAAIEILKAIGAAEDSTIVVAHEFMGMPTVLAALIEPSCDFKTVFYAHEIAAARLIVENIGGHDVAFYRALEQGLSKRLYIDDIYSEQNHYFKHPLVEASSHCHAICAVGDYAEKELRFLGPNFEQAQIEVVYNGVPAYKISFDEKAESKERLRQYCQNLLGYRPDHIFTHVTRLVTSKGLWRDLQILEYIEGQFRKDNKTAVLFVLSTEVGRRGTAEIMNMESAYGWPVAHRQGWPDLSGGEANFYLLVQNFNARSRNIKVIFINQFGFERACCGNRMAAEMEFMDIRRGTDVELGLSVYEPFGISHLEPLTFGGICVLSDVCGCAKFASQLCDVNSIDNIITGDYVGSADESPVSQIGQVELKEIESRIAKELAGEIVRRLPQTKTDVEKLIKTGYQLATKMSWQTIVNSRVLPALQNARSRSFAAPLPS